MSVELMLAIALVAAIGFILGSLAADHFPPPD